MSGSKFAVAAQIKKCLYTDQNFLEACNETMSIIHSLAHS